MTNHAPIRNLRRIILGTDSLVARTAAAELNAALRITVEAGVGLTPAAGDAVLAVVAHPFVRPLIRSGRTDLHNRPADRDAFHVLVEAGVLWILGSSERGVLQGVHELANGAARLAAGRDLTGSFAFAQRIFSPILGGRLFEASTPVATTQACVRHLSLLGASHVAATHDFAGGVTRDLHAYVETALFPQAAEPGRRRQLRSSLRAIIEAAGAYGLEVLFDARLIPCQGGPWVAEAERQAFLAHFPAEVLADSGTYQGKVLCFGHPLVQEFFTQVVAAFFRDFPEISLFHYLTMDAEGEFCDPQTCPRCRGLSKFDQRDRLARFLEQHMTRVRPGIRILNTSFQWDRDGLGIGQLLARQATLPEAVGLCLSATGDSATFERQSHQHLQQARAVTWRSGQLVIGRDALHAFEDEFYAGRQCFDYPLGVFAKIRRWHELGYDGFYDVRGRLAPEDVHANSLACRAAMLDPAADADVFIDRLTGRWFGADAGPLVAAAWRRLEQAQAIRSNGYAFPSSSPLSEYVGWHFNQAHAPVPSNPKFTAQPLTKAAPRHGELPPAEANGYVYREGDYPARLTTAGGSLVAAAGLCAEAVALLDRARALPMPGTLDAGAWVAGAPSRSPGAYLDDHRAFVANQQRFWAVMGPYLILKALRMTHGDAVEEYRREAATWLPSYADAADALADHLDCERSEGRVTAAYPDCFSPATLRARATEVRVYLA